MSEYTDAELQELLNGGDPLPTGYNTPQPGAVPVQIPRWSPEGNSAPTPTVATYTYSSRTYVPGTDEVPAVEPVVRNKALFANIANQGWNTWARSIEAVPVGGYLIFSAAAGISGACLALGVARMDGRGTHLFSHSMIVDISGVYVYEFGVEKDRLRLSHNPVSTLRIYRHSDNSVVFVVTTEKETMVYTSLNPCRQPTIIPMYIYGYLYSSGDKVTGASFKTGEVQYGSV